MRAIAQTIACNFLPLFFSIFSLSDGLLLLSVRNVTETQWSSPRLLSLPLVDRETISREGCRCYYCSCCCCYCVAFRKGCTIGCGGRYPIRRFPTPLLEKKGVRKIACIGVSAVVAKVAPIVVLLSTNAKGRIVAAASA